MILKITNEDLHKTGVYCIKNLINKKIYIGSTSTGFYNRYHQHLSDYKKNKHSSPALKKAFDKYNIVNFEFSILCICKKEDCIKTEQWFIDNTSADYNSCLIAGSLLGYKHPSTSKTKTVVGGKHHSAAPVDQYSKSGLFIKSFACVSDAIKEVGLVSKSGIIQCCKGKVYSAGGFRWCYFGCSLIQRPNRFGKTKVIITKNNKKLFFESQVDAAKFLNVTQGRVSSCLKRGCKINGFTIKKNNYEVLS